jgi:hypothetical protein
MTYFREGDFHGGLSRIALTIGVTDFNGEAYSEGIKGTSAPVLFLRSIAELAVCGAHAGAFFFRLIEQLLCLHAVAE